MAAAKQADQRRKPESVLSFVSCRLLSSDNAEDTRRYVYASAAPAVG